MNNIRVLILTTSFFLFTITTFGQISETYFQDSHPREEGKITSHIKGDDYIIYSGQSFDQFRAQPSVSKIDLHGNRIWTTTTYDSSIYNSEDDVSIQHIMQSGDFIYASYYKRLNYEEFGEIWKIAADSGEIIWKAPFTNGNRIWSISRMIDYDETKLIVGFFGTHSVEGETTQMAVVDKTNGQTISISVLGEFEARHYPFGLVLDNQKKLYYSDLDKIVKIDPLTPENIIWEQSYPDLRILDFHHFYVDDSNDLYGFARLNVSNGAARLLKINTETGDLVWSRSTPYLLMIRAIFLLQVGIWSLVE